MRLAIKKWNISVVGKMKPISYYGYPTKKEALDFVERWNNQEQHELKVELIKLENNKWVRV